MAEMFRLLENLQQVGRQKRYCKLNALEPEEVVDLKKEVENITDNECIPIDFVILDVKEDKKKPLIKAKAVIRIDKGTITLKSGKNKIDFVKVPSLPSETEKNTEDDLDPITPTNTISRLILEWEERVNYHQEKEMEFNR
ncbi:hypothetical protein Tco_0608439 [Tanacetum coccineum]